MVNLIGTFINKLLFNNSLKIYVMRIIRIIYIPSYFDIIDLINPLIGFI